MVCRNPLLGERRARKREELLRPKDCSTPSPPPPADAGPLKGTSSPCAGRRPQDGQALRTRHRRARLRLLQGRRHRRRGRPRRHLIVRTSLPPDELGAAAAVAAYRLSVVERAFRSYKTVDLKVRPIYHYADRRVRAHVFLCMLAYYVEWHMRQRLAAAVRRPRGRRRQGRAHLRRRARRGPDAARDKARSKRTAAGLPVHSFQTLLGPEATIARNRVLLRLPNAEPFDVVTRPTASAKRSDCSACAWTVPSSATSPSGNQWLGTRGLWKFSLEAAPHKHREVVPVLATLLTPNGPFDAKLPAERKFVAQAGSIVLSPVLVLQADERHD